MSSNFKDIYYGGLVSIVKDHVAPQLSSNLQKKGIKCTTNDIMACFPDANTAVTTTSRAASGSAAASTSGRASSATTAAPTPRSKDIKCEKAGNDDERCCYWITGGNARYCDNVRFDDWACENCITNKRTYKKNIKANFPDAYPEEGETPSMGGAAPTPFANAPKGNPGRRSVAPLAKGSSNASNGVGGSASSSSGGGRRSVGHKEVGVGQPMADDRPMKTIDSIQVRNRTYYDPKTNLVFFGDQTEGYNCVGKLDPEISNTVCQLEDEDIELCEELELHPVFDHELIGQEIPITPMQQATRGRTAPSSSGAGGSNASSTAGGSSRPLSSARPEAKAAEAKPTRGGEALVRRSRTAVATSSAAAAQPDEEDDDVMVEQQQPAAASGPSTMTRRPAAASSAASTATPRRVITPAATPATRRTPAATTGATAVAEEPTPSSAAGNKRILRPATQKAATEPKDMIATPSTPKATTTTTTRAQPPALRKRPTTAPAPAPSPAPEEAIVDSAPAPASEAEVVEAASPPAEDVEAHQQPEVSVDDDAIIETAKDYSEVQSDGASDNEEDDNVHTDDESY